MVIAYDDYGLDHLKYYITTSVISAGDFFISFADVGILH